MTRTLKTIAAAVLMAWALAPRGEAAGLRTKFGEVVISGLKIGQTYSLNQLLNLPLRVLNTGEESIDLKIDVIRAPEDQLKRGYEVVPSTGWVALERREFAVEPNHEAVTDVVISIPNDPGLLGRRFQADLWSRSASKTSMFGVGMQSRLLIQIDSTPSTEEELKKKFVNRKLANLDFTLHPTVGHAEDVPLGRDVDLKKERKLSIKLINPNEEKLTFRIRSVPNWEALLAMPAGYEEAHEMRWLRPAAEVVEVEGNSIKDTSLVLNIPDADRYRDQAFFFPVSVEILEQEIPARVYYRLTVKTQGRVSTPEQKK